MSSVPFVNGTPTDDPSHTLLTLSSATTILPHPYLSSNSNVNYSSIPPGISSSSSVYPQYYTHSLPQQPLLHMPQTPAFYPGTNLNHLPHHGEFSNSSSSAASSSSSLESAKKPPNRKRPMPTKATGKRKVMRQIH